MLCSRGKSNLTIRVVDVFISRRTTRQEILERTKQDPGLSHSYLEVIKELGLRIDFKPPASLGTIFHRTAPMTRQDDHVLAEDFGLREAL